MSGKAEMDINTLIKEIKKRRDLPGVVHHEVIAEHKPRYGRLTRPLPGEAERALSENLGIKTFYTHQAEGIDLVREGRNVVVMTPTASGKSLVYNVPVIESLLEDPTSHALYIFPLKGLEQDQLRAFNKLAEGLPIERAGVEATGKKRKAYTPGVCEI